jgi:hypothetical protein
MSSAGLAVAFAAVTPAAITFHEAAIFEVYTQASSAAPVTPSFASFSARIFTNVADQVTAGTVTTPSAGTKNLTPISSTVTGFIDDDFADRAAAQAVYGAGNYTFTVDGGVFDGASDTVNFQNPGFATTVPHLTGDSWDDLQNLDPSDSLTLTWNNFTAPGDHTALRTYLNIFNITQGTSVYANSGAPGSFLSENFAAGTFQVGNQYQFTLTYGSLTQSAGTGSFSSSFRTGSHYLQTRGTFTPVPEPATFALLGLGALALRRRRK